MLNDEQNKAMTLLLEIKEICNKYSTCYDCPYSTIMSDECCPFEEGFKGKSPSLWEFETVVRFVR